MCLCGVSVRVCTLDCACAAEGMSVCGGGESVCVCMCV